MNDEEQKNFWQELKCAWQEHKPSNPALTADEQIAAIRKKMAKMHPGLNGADLWAAVLYAAVTIPFIVYIFTIPYFVTRIGALIIIGGYSYSSWKTIRRRRSIPQPIADAPVMEWLRFDLAKVRQHAEDNRTMLWWYLMPFLIGTLVFLAGLPGAFSKKVGASILVVVIAAFTWWLSQRVRRKQWLPLQKELEALLIDAPPVPPSEPSKKSVMPKIILIGIVLISLGAIVFVHEREIKTPAIEYSDAVSQTLETIRRKHNLPALAVAVVVDGKLVVTNAVGFRKNGGAEKVTVDDRYHLGSVTKSMTATVAAMLVEQGKLSWTATIGEVFSEFKNDIHPDYLGATLEQLLSHRGGAPGDAPGDLWGKAWEAKGTAAEQRLAFIKGILTREPESKPGTKHIYSNQGYAIAGVMLERAAGKTWEVLLRSMLFEPLGMTTAGFGAPASVGKVDQPWGHTKALLSAAEPVPPGPRADNPLAITPAGAVHCSVGDLAKYAAFHMAGERGESKLLKAESFKKLHTAVSDDDYALGWLVKKRAWAKGRTLVHAGSNTMFYVIIWIAPELNCSVIVASNIGVDEAFAGCDEAAVALIEQFFPK